MNFDTPEGRAEIDTALCRLGQARPGDVLLIRFEGHLGAEAAFRFRDALMNAAAALPEGTLKHPIPVVVVDRGVSWELESIRVRP